MDYSKLYTELNNQAIQTRGYVIHVFCLFEQEVIDIIILEWGLENDIKRKQFIEENLDWKISMKRKQKLLKKGIKIYEEKYNEKLTGLYDNIDSIIESRNVLAHWMTDNTYAGIEHYHKTNSIRFLAPNMKYAIDLNEKNTYKEFLFDMNKLQKLKTEMDNVRDQLIKIVNKIIS